MDQRIASLLHLAELIQQKIENTQEQNEKDVLQNDLNIVMDEIGKRVFELPINESIFPKINNSEEVTERLQENSISSIKEPSSTKAQSLSLNSSFFSSDLGKKFDAFLKSKESESKS